jgi:hypothetical protein
LKNVFAGGPDLDVRMPNEDPYLSVRGRLVTWNGEAVPDADIGAGFVVTRIPGSQSHLFTSSTKTDIQGRFDLMRVPRRPGVINVQGDDLVTLDSPVPEDPSRDVRLEVETRGRIHLELADPQSADAFELRDGQDKVLEVLPSLQGTPKPCRRLTIAGAPSVVCEGSSRAVVIVLFKDGKEVRRAPIEIRRGAVSTVQL